MTSTTQSVSSPQPAAGPENEHDYRWLAGPFIVVLAFLLVALAMSRHVDIPFRDPGGVLFWMRFGLSIVLFCLFVVVDTCVRTRLAVQAWRQTFSQFRQRWPLHRLAVGLSGLLAYHVVYVSYRNLKSWVAFHHVHDTQLLHLDRWIFFGHDPAPLLHSLFGEHAAAHVLALVYRSFALLVPVSFVVALVFANRIRDGYVFLMSAIWVWILGVGSYYLIPALGPFARVPGQFAHLSHTAITKTQAKYLHERWYLLHHSSAGDAISSISAFASLHVGYTFMALLVVRSFGFRRATIALSIYLVGVIFATIYFGWHYAVDDVAGLAVGFLAALLGRWVVYPSLHRRSKPTNEARA